jgi:serine/threonine protein kinase
MSASRPLPLQDALVGGKYRLGTVIGSGGVGTVYRAEHLWTERQVAVKILDPNLPHFDQLRGAFLREARATVQLEHPNVVDVLDMGEDDAGTTYLVMELLDGPTLRDVLLEEGRLSPEATMRILLPLIDALDKAHELGIVHQDFKPENIILSVDAFDVMTPKLLDFGVAQILREVSPHGLTAPSDLIVGTPQYMSPEQARDQRHLVGPQTDVWGVGVLWYECLTGRPPFDGDTALETLTAVCEAPIDFEQIPDDHVPLLRKALERSPRQRTPDLSEFRAQAERSGLVTQAMLAERAPFSSRPPANPRPSYIRRTLSGVGPSDRPPMGAPEVPLDSELLELPVTSHRKVALAGAALALAVGLAAWWTIGGASRNQSAPEKLLAVEPVELSSEPVPEKATPGNDRQPPPEMNVVQNEPSLAVEETESQSDSPPSEPIPKTKPSRANPRPSAGRVRHAPSTDLGYEKPPDLVTEW